MKVQTVRDVVSWSANYHATLESQYLGLAAKAFDERICMLLEYLASHEHQIEVGLRRYLDTAPPGLLSTWSRSGPSLPQPTLLEELKSCLCCTSVEAITELAVRIHTTLGGMYSELVELAELENQRELLTALCDYEEAETRRMVRDTGRFEAC